MRLRGVSAKALRALPYWPHAGLGVALVMNAVGLVTKDTILIATASNMLVICGLFLGQRRKNSGGRV